MRFMLLLLAFWVCNATAQIPRTKSGRFEYSGVVSGVNTPVMQEKARSFFNQPFLVHWDSVAHIQHYGSIRVIATGHIMVRAKQHSVSLPAEVPVYLQFSIEVKDGRYGYSVNQFQAEMENALKFPLEDKPDSVKKMVYDQLLKKTHERVSFVIGWLKRYMKEQEGQ